MGKQKREKYTCTVHTGQNGNEWYLRQLSKLNKLRQRRKKRKPTEAVKNWIHMSLRDN